MLIHSDCLQRPREAQTRKSPQPIHFDRNILLSTFNKTNLLIVMVFVELSKFSDYEERMQILLI